MLKRHFSSCVSIFFFVVLFSILLESYGVASFNIPLVVSDYAGIDRIEEPITTGVPLPESENITSIKQLKITDASGNKVPAQFTVLARWRGTPDDSSKPIKWVLLDFQGTVPRNGSTLYYLQTDANGGDVQETSLSLQQDDDYIIINTGKAVFYINKQHFNIFDRVYVDKDGDGKIDDPIIFSPDDGGGVLTDRNGKKYYSKIEPPEEIKVELEGPMRIVINVRGVFKASDGAYFAPSIHHSAEYPKFDQPYPHSFVYYNCRMYFYNNQDYVRIFFTLENNGANGRTNPEQYFAPVQAVYFDSLNLVLKTASAASAKVISEDSSTSLSRSDSFVLYQDWHENLSDSRKDTLEPTFDKGIYFVTKKNSKELSSGLINPGWIDVNDNSTGIGVAVREFWQNFPKKLTVTPGEIKIGLWPEEGYYPYCQHSDFPDAKYDMYCKNAGKDAGVYLFDAGRHKTYEMLLRFYPGNQDLRTRELSKSLEEPLMAIAPSEWYATTKALGMIAPVGLSSQDPGINEAMELFEKLQSAMVYEKDSDNGWTIFNIKTKNPPHWEFQAQNRFFNWMNFGDLLWSSSSPCNLHYDWTYSMLLHYIRAGKRSFFDAGVEMAKYRYDVGQYHGDRTDTNKNHKYINHFQFYESSGHADPSLSPWVPSRVSIPTHTWNGGLMLYYLLTGDKKAWEAAEENGKGILNYYGANGLRDAGNKHCTSDEIRFETWSILNLINLYRVCGNTKYLETAKQIAKNRILYTEQQLGGEGHWGTDVSSGASQRQLKPFSCDEDGCGKCKNTQWSTMYIYAIEPLINITYETGDQDLKDLIVRMADFLKDRFLFGGDFDENGKYRPIQSQYLWVAEDPDGSVRGTRGEPIKTIFWADLFAYAYQLTSKAEYLEWARKCFRDGVFYYALPGSTYYDPGIRSPISFMEGQFPNSHTKVHGRLGWCNEIYLYTEWRLQKGILRLITTSLPKGIVGVNYEFLLNVAGGKPPYTWKIVSGTLPTGLSLNSSTGVISGIPLKTGSYTFSVQISDTTSSKQELKRHFSITVGESDEHVKFITSTLPDALVGEKYNNYLSASGGVGTYHWSIVSGNLPPGLQLKNNQISGIPVTPGIYSFLVKLTDSASHSVIKNFSINVVTEIAPLIIATSNLPAGGTGKYYEAYLIASGGTPPYVWSVSMLPPGLSSNNSGEIFGVPSKTGTFSIECTVKDSSSSVQAASKNLILRITPASSDTETFVTYPKVVDTTLDGSSEKRANMNLGGVDSLYTWSDGVRRILLRGDLSEIPEGAQIERAELKLYCYSLRWPYKPYLYVYALTRPWEEGDGVWYQPFKEGATWYEFNKGKGVWDVPGGDIDRETDFGNGANGITAVASITENSWVTFDVTSLVKKWVSGELENSGMLIMGSQRGYNEAKFYSSECADTEMKPLFIVTYMAKSIDRPSIISSGLPDGNRYDTYNATITADGGVPPYRWWLEGLPDSLRWETYTDRSILIYGTPVIEGKFSVKITVTDIRGKKDEKCFDIRIGDDEIKTLVLQRELFDTTLDDSSEKRANMNLGGVDSLYTWSDGVRRILLRGDLFEIPEGAQIERAELKLYCYSLRWPYKPCLYVYALTRPWEEGDGVWYQPFKEGATWCEFNKSEGVWDVPGGDIDRETDFGNGTNGVVAMSSVRENSWITFDITALVRKWVSGEMENNGLLIEGVQKGYNDARFYSSEFTDSDLRPVLVIKYIE